MLQAAVNRVKERKFAITQGFQIMSQSLLSHYNIADFVFEFMSVVNTHRNYEVKEEFCKFLKIVYATSIAYCFAPKNKENELIASLGNDTFPTPQFLNTEEVIPEEGEKSYGMQLNDRILR